MSVNASKHEELPAIDYADHTVEIDTRGLFANRPEFKAHAESSQVGQHGEAATGAELTPSQTHELLSRRK
jgi:hypothetical protein